MTRHEITGPSRAPVVVLGAAMGATIEMWEPQVAALAEDFRVVRYEHGEVPETLDDLGREVVALLDRLGAERVSFCGLSLGGIVGMWLALRAPERIGRLVLACTAAHLPPPQRWTDRAALVRTAGTSAVVADGTVGRWVTPTYAERHPRVVASLRAMVATTPPDLYAGVCDAMRQMDLRDEVGGITAPTLVIAAEHDEATPPAQGEWLASEIPGARFELIAGAAHLANVQRPDEFNRLLLAHLRRPPASPASRPAGR